MNYWSYWKREAARWVSISVLAGGLVSAVILFWVIRIESQVQLTSL